MTISMAQRCRVAAVALGRSAQQRRLASIYAADPGKWQSDACVQMYGQLLSVRDTQQDAFLVAADTLRAQSNLPRDLRASASRTRASVLFQQAARHFESLDLSVDVPWPGSAFDEALVAASRACSGYHDALAESTDPGLWREVLPHCPEWPDAVTAVRAASVEAAKLRFELRLREALWHGRQAERARIVANAARRGADIEGAAARAENGLAAVGLPKSASERDLWVQAVAAAKKLADDLCVEFCTALEAPSDNGTMSATATLGTLRSRAQALHMVLLKDLAVCLAMSDKLEEAVNQIVEALQLPVEDPAALEEEAATQIRAAAEGILELCSRQMEKADTQYSAHSAFSYADKITKAKMAFDKWRRAE